MVATVSDFKAQSYNGKFNAEEGQIKVEGTFATDSDKKVTAFNGVVKKANVIIGNFNSFYNGSKLQYNISNCDLDNIAIVAQAIKDAEPAVEEQIKAQ